MSERQIVPSALTLARAGSLDELYSLLKPLSTGPGWNKPTPSLWDEPRKTFVPYRWRYTQGKAALDAAGRLINTELAERRNLILFNPVPGNDYATTRTLRWRPWVAAGRACARSPTGSSCAVADETRCADRASNA